MRARLDALKAEVMMRVAGFIAQQHEAAWKRGLVRVAVRLNLARYGRDPLAFLEDDYSIDLLDYEAEDESGQAQAKPTVHRNTVESIRTE